MIKAARRRRGKKPTGERLQSEKVQYRLFCHAHGDRLINGTEGDLPFTAAGGQAQVFEMTVRGGKAAQTSLALLPVPDQYRWSPPQGPGPSTNVAQSYAAFACDYR
jgi:hypothetical protein